METGWKDGDVSPEKTGPWQKTSKHVYASGAERARRLVDVAEYLAEPDRALVQAVLGSGVGVPVIAEALGVHPTTVRSRIRRLRSRTRSKEFAFVALFGGTLGAEREKVARKCFLEGLSMRGAAAALGLSVHAVRQHRLAVIAQAEEYARGRSRGVPSAGVGGHGDDVRG